MAEREEVIAVRHRTALAATALAVATAVLALPGAAQADLAGFQVKLAESPAKLDAGGQARTIFAVAATSNQRCQKVRWSMQLQAANGASLDDVKITRIENDAEFPIQSSVQGDTAQLVDAQPDPGQLCRNRTDSARWAIAVGDKATQGRLVYAITAHNLAGVALASTTGVTEVAGTAAAAPTTPPATESPSPSPSPSESASDGYGAGGGTATDDPTESDAAVAPADTSTGGPDAQAVSKESNVPSLLGPGLIVGALFVFLGIGILLRLRFRSAKTQKHAHRVEPAYYAAPEESLRSVYR
jgi:hypothetical protein